MKRLSLLILLAAGALALAACTMESLPEEVSAGEINAAASEVGPVSFTVLSDCVPSTDSKAAIGTNGSGHLQTFWEDGDAISVYSSNDSDLSAAAGHKFVTSLLANAPEATFEWDGEGSVPSGDYLATYPNRTAGRGVNFSVSPYRVAAVDVPQSQTLKAGTFDRKAMPAVAFATEGSTTMAFKNAAALLKFRVSESDIKAGRIEVDPGDAISGRFRADVNTSTYETTLGVYNQPVYNYIDFTINGSTNLSTGTDYYVAIRPMTLTSDIKIYLNGNLVKTINTCQFGTFERNKIYNLGTLTTPANPSEKVLTFDFTGTPCTGWPTAKDSKATNQAGGLGCVYPWAGTDYTFTLADCTGASGRRIYWSTTATYGHRVVFENAERYLGFPAIPGYKLIRVKCVSSQLNDASASTDPKFGIVTTVVGSGAAVTYVTGGELQTWAHGNNHESYTYELSGTAANTVYYLFCKIKGAVRDVTLTYVPSYDSDELARVGTYNVRYITSEEDDQNNWVNRKTRVVQSIRENVFDVFGLQECSDDIKTYLADELDDTYTIRFFNPFRADGEGSGEAMGLAYKTAKYNLSDWHYYWLSDTPAVMVTNDGTKNRGGCCAILTDKVTGTKFFMMVTHGCLDADAREEHASQYEEMEKLYNPSGYPSFFVGDMNAQPSDPASVIYRTYWNDAYYSSVPKTGPYCTFNGFNLERNMYTHKNHLDYVYYRNATPRRYVCNDRLYGGYYASDHLPVYVDMKVD